MDLMMGIAGNAARGKPLVVRGWSALRDHTRMSLVENWDHVHAQDLQFIRSCGMVSIWQWWWLKGPEK